MIDYDNGWGNSTVSTKYIYQRVAAILDMPEGDAAYHLSRLSDELARSYKVDTGTLIGGEL